MYQTTCYLSHEPPMHSSARSWPSESLFNFIVKICMLHTSQRPPHQERAISCSIMYKTKSLSNKLHIYNALNSIGVLIVPLYQCKLEDISGPSKATKRVSPASSIPTFLQFGVCHLVPSSRKEVVLMELGRLVKIFLEQRDCEYSQRDFE